MPATALKTRPRQLLVVDDDVDQADTLRVLFELNGDRAVAAHSGARALEIARSVHPDVILCDIGMPHMDGFAFARAVRSDPSLDDVRLVAMTGHPIEPDDEEAIDSRFDLHILKPLPWGDICKALRRLEDKALI